MTDKHQMRPRYRTFVGKSWSGGRRLYVMQDQLGTRHESGVGIKVNVASGFTWNEHCEGDLIDFHGEGIAYADDLIQSILDNAWEDGMRPRGFLDIKNETAALRDHLSDLRTIAFKQLKIAHD